MPMRTQTLRQLPVLGQLGDRGLRRVGIDRGQVGNQRVRCPLLISDVVGVQHRLSLRLRHPVAAPSAHAAGDVVEVIAERAEPQVSL